MQRGAAELGVLEHGRVPLPRTPLPTAGLQGSDRTPGKGRDSPRVDALSRPHAEVGVVQDTPHLLGVLVTLLPLHCPDSFRDTLTAS